MNWETRYATPVTSRSRLVGGEGRAPVPTPRFAGARDWATKYSAPGGIENLKPFNDQGGAKSGFGMARAMWTNGWIRVGRGG